MTPTPEQNAKRTPRTDAIICQWSESAKPHTPDLAHYRQGCEALEAHAKDLETELQQKQKIIENHCKDWAEDDTAIKEICKRFGVPDVHPVGDDFKSCVECVEELAEKLQQLRLAADTWKQRAQEEHLKAQSRIGLIYRILRRTENAPYRDQGHVCENRKAVEAIVQMIDAHTKSSAAYRATGEGVNQAE